VAAVCPICAGRLHRGERDEGDAPGARPVREGSERLPDRLMTRASDRIVSPAMSTSAPTISVMRTG